MKLSELKAQQESERDAGDLRRRRERTELLHRIALDGPALYVPPDILTNRTNYEEARQRLRDMLNSDSAEVLGVECDHCGTALVNRQPGVITASDPPLRYIGCPGCGWLGYL